jgi:23S rRNA pseudouridine2605 synthase
MPPRHAYWTILIDDQPTAFRAHDADELLPTLNRLREKNTSAVMKWFERGKLYDSRDEARDAGFGQGERRWEGPRPERDDDGPRFAERPTRDDAARGDRPKRDEARGRGGDRPRDKNWRPGGEHRDPRQKYKDAKKAKWNRFKDKIRARHDERIPRNPESFTPPHGDQLRTRSTRPEWRRDDERRGGGSSGGDRDRRPWSDRPPRRDGDQDQRAWSDRPSRRDDTRDQRSWSDRPPRRDDPREQRPWSDRPPRKDSDREQRPWTDRPPRREADRDRGPSSARSPRREDDRAERSSYRGREGSGDWRPTGPAGRKPSGGGWPRANEQSRKPAGAKPWGAKPAGAARKPWGSKSSAGGGARKPWGSKPSGRPPASGRPPKRRRDDK